MKDAYDKLEDEKPMTQSIAATAEKSLAGRSVLVTRTGEQSVEMTARLEAAGAKVMHAPMIALTAPDSWDAIDEAIRKINQYDWIIFTSTNGVKFFFQRLAQNCRFPLAQITAAKICAIGKTTAKAILAVGAKADFVAKDSKAEGLVKEFVAQFDSAEALHGLRILLPRARLAREVLPEELRRLGAEVDALETYQNILPETAGENLLQLLQSGAIDIITFTSSSTVNNFAAVVGKDNLARLLQNVCVACIGPVTAATAQALGLQSIIQPNDYTAASLVEAIEQKFSSAPIQPFSPAPPDE